MPKLHPFLCAAITILLACGCTTKPEPSRDKLGPRTTVAAMETDIERAESQLESGSFAGAETIFERVIALSDAPDDLAVRAYLGRAQCRILEGEVGSSANALADAQQASLRWKSLRRRDRAAADALSPQLDRVYGDCALATNDPVTARTRYESALKSASRGGGKVDLDGLRFRRYLAAAIARDSDANDLKREVQHPERSDLVALADHFHLPATDVGGGGGMVRSEPETLNVGSITVLSRAKWGAHGADPKKLDPMSKIFRITVHHSAEATTETDERSVAAEIRSIQSGHQHGEGYADIGYHFVIDPAGRVWQGRDLKYQGAHAGNAALNAGNIGICLLGNFQEQSLPARQASALIALLEQLRSKYGVRREYVYGHGEIRKMGGIGGTECPGSRVQALVERYRKGGASP